MLTAYVRARAFDVLQRVTYHWRIREDLTSTGQQKARHRQPARPDRVKEEAHELLRAEASDAVYAAWVGRALEVGTSRRFSFALTATTGTGHCWRRPTGPSSIEPPRPTLRHVRVAMRARAHLAAAQRVG